MRKLTLIAFVMVTNIIGQSQDTSPDFRKAKWGMSMAQVKASETETIFKEEGSTIAYSTNVLSLDALVIYIFVNDKLVRAQYAFLEKHTNKNIYLTDYTSVNDAISDKYGSPKSDKEYWNNELYKSDFSQWGMAVSLGHYRKVARWETDETVILTVLSGDNYDISLTTEYSSKALATLEKQKKKNKNLSDF